MKHKTFIFAAVMFLGITLLSGYVNTAPRFVFDKVEYAGAISDAYACSEGLLAFRTADCKMGYIDTAGKTAIAPVFEYAESFSEGLAPAAVPRGKLGYIDTTGKYAIKPRFDAAQGFSDGLALVRIGDTAGYIDKTGRMVDLVLSPALTPVSSFKEGVAWVEDQNGQRGLIDRTGRLVIDCRYQWTMPFSQGSAWVSDDTGDDFIYIRMGLIDKQGNWLIKPGSYTDAQGFSEDVAWVREENSGNVCLIDTSGTKLADLGASRMPSAFNGGVSADMIATTLSIRSKGKEIIWSSRSYRPLSYGGFQNGCLLVAGPSGGATYIMRDTSAPQAQTQEPQQHSWTYLPEPQQNQSYEIALKIDSSAAFVNGEKKPIDSGNPDVKAYILNGHTMLPMRFIVENTPGWSVTWNYLNNSVLLYGEDTVIFTQTGNTQANVMRYVSEECWYSEQTVTMAQSPVINHDRLFLPVRAIGQAMNSRIFWDGRGLVVISNTRQELTQVQADQILAYFE